MKKLFKAVRRFLPLGFSVAVLVYLFGYRTDPQASLDTVKQVPVFKLALAVLFCVVSFVAAAWRLQILVRVLGYPITLSRCVVYTLVGHFYNSAIPGGAVGGDAIKALYLSAVTGSKPQAFAAVLVDRLCGLFMLAALALVMLLPNIGQESMRHAALVIAGFTGAASLAIFGMTSRRVRRLIPAGASSRLPFGDAIRAFDQAMQIYRGHKRGLLAALFLSVLPQAGWIFMHVALGSGIGVDLPWSEYAVLVPVTGMVAALPISFGGWGVGEAAAAYFFGLRGVPENQGMLVALLGRLVQLGWALLGLPLSFALPRPKDLAAAAAGEGVLASPEVAAAAAAVEPTPAARG